MKKTKIVCTIGPKTESVEKLTELVNAGMNVMRLNFSHGDYVEHGTRITNFRKVMEVTGKQLAILLDTKGQRSVLSSWKTVTMWIWSLAKSSLSQLTRKLLVTKSA